MKKFILSLTVSVLAVTLAIPCRAQQWAVGTNGADWLLFGTVNANGSVAVARHITVNAEARYNPWTFNKGDASTQLQMRQQRRGSPNLARNESDIPNARRKKSADMQRLPDAGLFQKCRILDGGEIALSPRSRPQSSSCGKRLGYKLRINLYRDTAAGIHEKTVRTQGCGGEDDGIPGLQQGIDKPHWRFVREKVFY